MRIEKKKSAMEQEIFEQPEILNLILQTNIDDNGSVNLTVPENIEKVVLVASGSSYHCARFAADLFGQIAHIEARAIYSSEFLLKSEVPHSPDILYVFVTQSGETSDTNKALNRAKEYGVQTLAVTNKKESTIWNAADYKIDCRAGEEKSIAATKSLTSQLLCLTLLVMKYAAVKGFDVSDITAGLRSLPDELEKVYELRTQIGKIAKFLSKFKSIVVTADGIFYALAKEAALKIQETSYINSNAIILGEFMHGHAAVLNSGNIPLIYVGDLNYTAIKNLNKIAADYNPCLVVLGGPNEKVKAKFEININCENDIVKAFCIVVTEQLLALEIANKLRRNVDKPKGLDKVVTE
ncbi:MAG: SIS domain-containing protein [Heliobacteriaceae bacterium]|jgi:glucosamine--fructose-6-phosphate aminotransferase (isomerizing)|nr:SIS domain-containing protein [Heliobacteriaceae bacterium]